MSNHSEKSKIYNESKTANKPTADEQIMGSVVEIPDVKVDSGRQTVSGIGCGLVSVTREPSQCRRRNRDWLSSDSMHQNHSGGNPVAEKSHAKDQTSDARPISA